MKQQLTFTILIVSLMVSLSSCAFFFAAGDAVFAVTDIALDIALANQERSNKANTPNETYFMEFQNHPNGNLNTGSVYSAKDGGLCYTINFETYQTGEPKGAKIYLPNTKKLVYTVKFQSWRNGTLSSADFYAENSNKLIYTTNFENTDSGFVNRAIIYKKEKTKQKVYSIQFFGELLYPTSANIYRQ